MEISIKCECGISHSISHYDKGKGIIGYIKFLCNCDKTYSSKYSLNKITGENEYKIIEALEN